MRLSIRTQYAALALLDLALYAGNRPVALKDIAMRQQIPVKYLQQISRPLIANGLVRSVRGARGGIQLNQPPYEIKLSQVFQVFEGSCAPVDCVDKPGICPRSGFCATRDIWGEIKKAEEKVLDSITLQDLAERQASLSPAQAIYSI